MYQVGVDIGGTNIAMGLVDDNTRRYARNAQKAGRRVI